MRYEMELRNLPSGLVMDFLVQAGGKLAGPRTAQGRGWTARLETLEPAQVGLSLSIPRDLLVIEGDSEDSVTYVYDFMRTNLIRGGG